MTDEVEKLACPFCGGQPRHIEKNFLQWIYCMKCGARSARLPFGWPFSNQVIRNWNQRAD